MSTEPNQANIRQWLDNLYARFQPVEQSRWNQSNIDTLFYAGSQSFVNQQFNFSPQSSYQQYYFNLVQQPINIITGYQRQHRKSITYFPSEGADPRTTDQYTRAIMHACNANGIHEQYSKACELAAVSGMVLMQPYLDYTQDQLQGDLKLKVWEYNSFLVDPFFRNPDMSDAQFVWCQEYITKKEAESRFPDKLDQVSPMMGSPQRYGSFYFLPENANMARNDLLVLSYVWYKWKKKRKRLYSPSRQQLFDFSGGDQQLEEILYNIPDLQQVEVEVPCWNLCTVLNDQLMYQGENPLGFDECPFVPVFWNYDPHINVPDLRVRSLVRTMRDPQFLFNYKVITNNDIAAATINAGWKRKSGAVANEDNLRRTGQGFDIIINEGYELSDVEKIIPSAVPQSDLELAEQMADLIYRTSGIQLENWSGQNDKQISALTAMIKQAANLLVFQKYFDQWDQSLKLTGDLLLKIILNNWQPSKMSLLLGEEPSPHFYSKIFAKYQVVVEEGLLTPTQKSYQAQQMMEINQAFGREVLPPSMIIKDMNIQGKAEIMEFLQQQEQMQQAIQQEESIFKHAVEDAKLKELYSRATANLSMSKERAGRFDANVGLLEERLSAISKNQSLSTKAKMEALEKMVDVVDRMGEWETQKSLMEIENMNYGETIREDQEREKAKYTTEGSEFLNQIMGGMQPPQQDQQQDQQQGMPQQQEQMQQQQMAMQQQPM